MKITIKIWELDSKNHERIIDNKTFDNRIDAEKYIQEYQAELKPYKMGKKTKYYEMS
jgi:hypothetical protein